MSAIVALALAAAVTLTAGIETYGISGNKDLMVYNVEASLERAYDEVTMEEELDFDFALEEEQVEIIKIYDKEDNLINSIVLEEGEVIENSETKKMLNQAEFLTRYNNTSLYKIN